MKKKEVSEQEEVVLMANQRRAWLVQKLTN
jgi:hypothetical protein